MWVKHSLLRQSIASWSTSSATMSATPMSARRFSPSLNSPMWCWVGPRSSPARRCWPPISAMGLRLRSKLADAEHVLLFDTGTEGAIFIRNCRNLALDLGEVEAIAITHGHWDHMGALSDAIDAIIKKRGRVTVHVNPGMSDHVPAHSSSEVSGCGIPCDAYRKRSAYLRPSWRCEIALKCRSRKVMSPSRPAD